MLKILLSYIFVYIDALTGENLGGDSTLATYARSVTIPDGYRAGQMADEAERGLCSLGYTHHLNSVYYDITQTDIEYILMHSHLKGLFLTCHGNLQFISNKTDYASANWVVPASRIPSGWKFVFLNSCLSANISSLFPKNFIDVNGANQCFVGWNVEVPQVTAYWFSHEFWRRVGNASIHSVVLLSSNAVTAQGYSQCNAGFWGDINYNGKP